MPTYYNENDPLAAAWLRELIKQGHLPDGKVDERDIRDVTPNDLRGFNQCHFFAGIGGWAHALKLAEWPADRSVWTGSCPCQPFSTAGRRKGDADERHLWPAFFHLIRQCRPDSLFGEQVASKDGITWLDLVSADLEGEGYAIGSTVLPACSVGAPHKRDRIWFVAEPSLQRRQRLGLQLLPRKSLEARFETARSSKARNLGFSRRSRGRRNSGTVPSEESKSSREREELRRIADKLESAGAANPVGDANEPGLQGGRERAQGQGPTAAIPGPVNGFWGDAEWIPCRDGKYRAIKSGIKPMVDGLPRELARVRNASLKGYGNAIVPQVAAEVIKAFLQSDATELP